MKIFCYIFITLDNLIKKKLSIKNVIEDLIIKKLKVFLKKNYKLIIFYNDYEGHIITITSINKN